jgi:hypothetical protein
MSLLVTFLIAISLALILRLIYQSLIEFLRSINKYMQIDDERKRND